MVYWTGVLVHDCITLRSWLHQKYSRRECSLNEHNAIVPELMHSYFQAAELGRHAQAATGIGSEAGGTAE